MSRTDDPRQAETAPGDGDGLRGRARRTAQGERSRGRLIEAATALLAERGYAATSVGEICRRAGVAKTALYWHFESKEGLLAAVIEQVGTSWIEEVTKAVYLEGPPHKRLRRLVDSWRSIVVERPRVLRLLVVVALERGDSCPRTRSAMDRVWRRAEVAVRQGLEDSVPVPVDDLEGLARTVLTLMQGAMISIMLDPGGADEARVFEDFHRSVGLTLNSRLPESLRLPLEP